MNEKQGGTFNIERGPEKNDILLAYRYSGNKNVTIPIKFDIALGYTAHRSDPDCCYVPMKTRAFRVKNIDKDRLDDELYIIYGDGLADLNLRKEVTLVPYEYEAYYNVTTRKGRINFFKKKTY